MNPTIQEEDIIVYASDATTIQEPQGENYSQGARVGRTIPAKWWNWLFREATKRLHQAFSDFTALFTEATNVILSADIVPSSSDNTQLTQAVITHADRQREIYLRRKQWYYAKIAKAYQSRLYYEPSNTTIQAISVFNSNIGIAYFRTYSTTLPYYSRECKCTIDGINWHDIPLSSYIQYSYTEPMVALFKVQNTYILICVYSPDSNNGGEYRSVILTSKNLDEWSRVTPFPTSNPVDNSIVAFTANGVLYLAAENKGVAYTADGESWNFSSVSGFLRSRGKFVNLKDASMFNGQYLVGNMLFNPSTLQFTSLIGGSSLITEPSIQMFNGTIIYYGHTVTVNYAYPAYETYYVQRPGEAAVQNTIAGYSVQWRLSSDKKAVFKYIDVSGTRTTIFSLDGINVASTLTTVSNNIVPSCEYANGWYYYENKRTQDFSTWEDIPNVPFPIAQATVLNTGFSDIVVIFDNTAQKNYVTFDYCAHWIEMEMPMVDTSTGQKKCTAIVSRQSMLSSLGMCYEAKLERNYLSGGAEGYLVMLAVSESVNHVMGYTLYLR